MSTRSRLLAIAADWGRTDVERRHRAGLLSALRAAGVESELLVLGTDPFDPRSLGNWAGIVGQQAQLDRPDSLVAQTAAVRAVLGRQSASIVWGLDSAGNQASRVAQALDRSTARVVTAVPDAGAARGLKRIVGDLLAKNPNLTLDRTGRAGPRDTVTLAPGLDLGQLRRHSPDSVARMMLRQAKLASGDTLLAGWAASPGGRAALEAIDLGLRSRGASPRWLWLGDDEPPALNTVPGAHEEVAGNLPLLSVVHALVAPDADAASRLWAREAVALGRPAFVAPGSPDADESIGLRELPTSPGDAAGAILGVGDDSARASAAWARAKADWSVTDEARRLADTLLSREA